MGKQGETLKKKIPSDFQKLVCSHCLGMVDKQMVLAVSILLTGKLQTLFTDSLNTAQLLDLTLCPPGEQEKGPCHTKVSILVRGGGCIISVALLSSSTPSCSRA